MNKHSILEILSDWSPWRKKLPSGIKRSKYMNILIQHLGTNLIKVIVGFRRSGKTYLMRQIIEHLIDKKTTPHQNILYINFEDDRLNEYLDLKGIRTIYETYISFINPKGKIYLFLDEIQLIPNFEKFIRTIKELKQKDIEIFITGSNSDLLSSEISSSLSGRFLEFKIYPLDFKEFLQFNNLIIKNPSDIYLQKQEIEILFTKFLKFGGLPEISFLSNEEQKINYLRGVFAKIVLDDIIKRFKIREVDIFEKVIIYILSNTSKIINPSKISQIIFGNKNTPGKELSIAKYISYAKQAFLLFELPKFNWKEKRIFDVNKKYYALDLGIRECHKTTISNDYSRKIENLIFLKLIQKNHKCFYGMDKNQKEIDFLIEKKGIFDKYQICTNLHKDNIDREFKNFSLAQKHLSGGKNILLSFDQQEEQIIIKGTIINKVNILQFLLFDN